MEQRRLRLGDILDDYCPRERRVTNHAVVAMIEEDVKQTRCTTCDAEHAYKGARVPARRKKETTAALFKEVLAGMPDADDAPVVVADVPALAVAPPLPVVPIAPAVASAAPGIIAAQRSREELPVPMHNDDLPADPAASSEFDADDGAGEAPVVDGPVHRPLIRATLPRTEGQKEARPATDFTIRQTPPRGNGHGGFRADRDRMRMRGNGGGGNGNGNSYGGNGNGNRQNGSPRFQGNRPPGAGRSPVGRAGGSASGFRGHGNGNGQGSGNGNKRGRGPRG